MDAETIIATIKPGDILLYHTKGDLMAAAITLIGPASHVEFYEGNGFSLASRDGLGVERYPLRTNDLVGILRPVSVDVGACTAWFQTKRGNKYSWQGLSGFVLHASMDKPDQQFCSGFVAWMFDATAQGLFNKDWAHNLITPSDFFKVHQSLLHWQWVDTQNMWI